MILEDRHIRTATTRALDRLIGSELPIQYRAGVAWGIALAIEEIERVAGISTGWKCLALSVERVLIEQLLSEQDELRRRATGTEASS